MAIAAGLQGIGYATNTGEGKIFPVNLQTYTPGTPIALTANWTKFTCPGTHGIAYIKTNNRIYAECTGISGCVSPYTNATKCTSAHWEVDHINSNVTRRIVSPYLSGLSLPASKGLGVLGKPISSPEESLILASNSNFKMIHIYRPGTTAGDFAITEALIANTGTACTPGTILYYSKDLSIEFGSDPNPANYVAVIALEGISASCGIAFLDLATPVAALNAKVQLLPASAITYLDVVNGGGSSRPIAIGGKYIVISSYSYVPVLASDPMDSFVLVSILTKSIVQTYKVPGLLKLSYVPIITGELKYQVAALNTEVAALSSSISSAAVSQSSPATLADSAATTVDNGSTSTTADSNKAIAALVLASVALFTSIIALILTSIMFHNSRVNKSANSIRRLSQV